MSWQFDGVTFGIPTLVVNCGLRVVYGALDDGSGQTDTDGLVDIGGWSGIPRISGGHSKARIKLTAIITGLDDLVLAIGVGNGQILDIVLGFNTIFGANDLISIANDRNRIGFNVVHRPSLFVGVVVIVGSSVAIDFIPVTWESGLAWILGGGVS